MLRYICEDHSARLALQQNDSRNKSKCAHLCFASPPPPSKKKKKTIVKTQEKGKKSKIEFKTPPAPHPTYTRLHISNKPPCAEYMNKKK